MFQVSGRSSKTRGAFGLLELIYHATTRELRKNHSNAVIGLLLNMMQTMILVLSFYLMFQLLGMKNSPLRGDFLLYIMSGIFLYITHIKAMGAVLSSEGPASPMMQHAPMNTAISIAAAALSSLYIQIISMLLVLTLYHTAMTPITIDKPISAFWMLLLSWFTGVAMGVLFLAMKPWAPGLVGVVSAIYSRVNMIASGKMFLANSLPASKLALFDWNPLFHTIDQTRGFTFLHYNPHFSSSTYPLYVGATVIMIGLMGEFYTRKHASASWSAGR